jgi:hypothetical protein
MSATLPSTIHVVSILMFGGRAETNGWDWVVAPRREPQIWDPDAHGIPWRADIDACATKGLGNRSAVCLGAWSAEDRRG